MNYPLRISRVASRSLLALVVAALAWAGSASASEDSTPWNQWRGPHRDARAPWFPERSSWPQDVDVVWAVDVGLGHASPVTNGEQVCVHARVDDSETASCYDLADGRQLWSASYPVAFKAAMGGGHHGAGPKSTPVISDGRLVTYGITSVLSAFDVESGRLLWRRDFGSEADDSAWPRWGTSYSPLALDGDVVVQFGRGEGALLRVDGDSGETVWELAGDGSAYSSPILIERAGVRQIVSATNEELLGVTPDGEVLWRTEHPSGLMHQGIATPLNAGDLLVVSTGNKPLRALDIERAGSGWRVNEAWQRDDVTLEMGSLVAYEDRICGLWQRRKGQAFCLSATDGSTIWESAPRFGEHASVLVVPGALLYQLADAELVVVDPAADAYRELARLSTADSEVWAHPLPLPDGRIVVKSRERLALLDLLTTAGSPVTASATPWRSQAVRLRAIHALVPTVKTRWPPINARTMSPSPCFSSELPSQSPTTSNAALSEHETAVTATSVGRMEFRRIGVLLRVEVTGLMVLR